MRPFLLLITLLGASVEHSCSFVPPVTTSTTAGGTTALQRRTTHPGMPKTILTGPTLTHLQMSSVRPLHHPENHMKNFDVTMFMTGILLALALAFSNPSPTLMEEELPPIGSSTQLISKLEVKPLGGGGFGGIGIGPGFMPLPFGGFGAGFTVHNTPPPPTDQQVLQASKQKLEAIKEYSRQLEEQVKTMEQQQQQAGTKDV